MKGFYRYLGHLKLYVQSKAQPKGSIAEGYLAEEIFTFCSQYMERMETRTNRPSCVDESSNTYIFELNTLFPPIGRVVSVASTFDTT